MTVYNVHLYPAVRVKVCNVEAESMEAAIEKAATAVDFYSLFNSDVGKDLDDGMSIVQVEYAEDVPYYLVDVVGDEDFEQSHFFDFVRETGELVPV